MENHRLMITSIAIYRDESRNIEKSKKNFFEAQHLKKTRKIKNKTKNEETRKVM